MCIHTCRNFSKCPQYMYCHHHKLCRIRLNCLFLNTAGTVNTTFSILKMEAKVCFQTMLTAYQNSKHHLSDFHTFSSSLVTQIIFKHIHIHAQCPLITFSVPLSVPHFIKNFSTSGQIFIKFYVRKLQ